MKTLLAIVLCYTIFFLGVYLRADTLEVGKCYKNTKSKVDNIVLIKDITKEGYYCHICIKNFAIWFCAGHTIISFKEAEEAKKYIKERSCEYI